MCTSKSHIDFVDFYTVLLTQDMVRHHGDPLNFRRDAVKLQRRVRNEGFSFLTKTLPLLGKAVDKALCDGVFTCPPHFSKVRGTAYPKFLTGLLKRVFHPDGVLKTDADVSAVRDLRQICFLLYKYELPHNEEVIDEFFESFKNVDRNLPQHIDFSNADGQNLARALKVANALLNDLLEGYTSEECIPGHGPGAVASGEKNWEKMTFRTHYECIHQKFPYYKFFSTNAADLASNVKEYWDRERVPSGIAKVVLVPKDSRGPRLISMEPLEFQWIQHGIMKALVKRIENHPLTRGHVNFTDQEINQQHALQGSVSGDSVTLDMKEASDRVSCWLVDILFAGTKLLPELMATRTEATELPSQEVVLLRKFAPMGSALCFPIESLVHWALAVSTLHVFGGVRLKRARAAVYVYGDDIVIKGQNHAPLFSVFPKFGLRFNEGKCCTTGSFRESCGMDAFLGQDVTPLKIKKLAPSQPYDAHGYVSYISYVNRLWSDAYYSSSKYMEDQLVKLYGPIPHVRSNSDVPGFTSDRSVHTNAGLFRFRWNKNLQRWEHKVKALCGKKVYAAMDRREYHRKMVTDSEEFLAGVYMVPRHVKLKTRWSGSLW